MQPRRRVLSTSAAGVRLATTSLVAAQDRGDTGVKSGYAPVNGLQLYYVRDWRAAHSFAW